MKNKKNISLTILGWTIFAILIGLFVRNGNEIIEVFSQVQWQWFLVALMMQAGNYFSAAFALDNLLQHFGHRLPFKVLARNSFMVSYLNQTLPSWGMGGVTFMILDLKHYQVSPAKSMTVGVIYYALTFFAFFIILVGSFVGLFLNKQLEFVHVTAAFVAFIGVLAVSIVLLVSFFKRNQFKKIVKFILAPVRSMAEAQESDVKKEDAESLEKSIKTESVSEELQHTFRSLWKAGWFMWGALLWSLTFHFFDIATLYVLFLGFGYPISLSVLLGGFVLATVFGFISFVPGAVGVFETSMALMYASLGVPFHVATIVALAFRGLGFWLPIPIGGWLSKQFFHKTLKKENEE